MWGRSQNCLGSARREGPKAQRGELVLTDILCKTRELTNVLYLGYTGKKRSAGGSTSQGGPLGSADPPVVIPPVPEWVIGMDMLRSGQNPPFGSLPGGVEASSEGRWSGGP